MDHSFEIKHKTSHKSHTYFLHPGSIIIFCTVHFFSRSVIAQCTYFLDTFPGSLTRKKCLPLITGNNYSNIMSCFWWLDQLSLCMRSIIDAQIRTLQLKKIVSGSYIFSSSLVSLPLSGVFIVFCESHFGTHFLFTFLRHSRFLDVHHL